MRVPLSWLREYVDIDLPVSELAELLTNAGLEVESIDLIGLPGAELEWDQERIVLAQVLRVEQHPDADVSRQRGRILRLLEQQLGATLRG